MGGSRQGALAGSFPLRLRLLRGTEASSLVEFAVALPLLVVLVVGIFDFGAAFNLKQELSNAAREGARFGASTPTNDLSLATTPPSVDAIRFLVDDYLKAAKINDCGLGTLASATATTGATTPPYTIWTYSSTSPANGCPGTFSLAITRELTVPITIGGFSANLTCTQVIINYPYQWHFNNVIQLIVPGATYASITNIPVGSVVGNTD